LTAPSINRPSRPGGAAAEAPVDRPHLVSSLPISHLGHFRWLCDDHFAGSSDRSQVVAAPGATSYWSHQSPRRLCSRGDH